VKAHPYTTFKLIDGLLEANFPESNRLRRQDMTIMFYPYGGIYATFFEKLSKNKTFYPTRLGLVEMQPQQQLEIDEPDDFALAEMLIQRYLHRDGIHMKLETSLNG
jgi:CMP-N-acetylneuraminic acid synthetase